MQQRINRQLIVSSLASTTFAFFSAIFWRDAHVNHCSASNVVRGSPSQMERESSANGQEKYSLL